MENALDIDFYQDKDEEAFLEAWETKYGELEDSAIDALYQEIAQNVHQQVNTENHKLGDKYFYQQVFVGYSDYNTFNNLYLFTQSKR
ncbi:hypothetical protein JTF06_07075 [Desemzia sp. RIT804]|uniref:hypothetical protein n=1 Tax=Desemzia sp. RIT 804 TaxID=2810209 RepID=UPI00194FBC3A|nr:hypothetical protein [Desemzia sp. RIT 804]MBM6614649.1 hypothetical protein [Desemzia sp. RIT 804]